MNSLLKSSKFQTDSPEKKIMVERIRKIFKNRLDNINGDASDYSLLAWLHIHINDIKSAKKALQIGLDIDPNNHHCLKLKETLNID